jgi:hypothetical protein
MTHRMRAEYRSAIEGNTLTGYAAIFDGYADLGSEVENIDPKAFDALLGSAPDVRCLVNHDPNQLLGRTTAGTLRLSVDGKGLKYECDLPNTRAADDLRELLKRGDITGSSFGFIPGDQGRGRAPDGRVLRTHTNIRTLLDVSPVTYPAYEGASSCLRSMTFDAIPPERVLRDQLIRARARVLFGKA